MIIVVDTITFQGKYDNGKEQVLLNLFKGFQDIGVGEHFRILCYGSKYKFYNELIPDAEFVVVKDGLGQTEERDIFHRVIRKIKRVFSRRMYIWKFKRMIQNNDFDIMFFTNKETANVKLEKPSVVIAHDIQAMSYPERFKDCPGIQDRITNDFKLRDVIISISDCDRNEMLYHFPQYANKLRKIYDPIICRNDINKGIRKGIVCINVNYPHKNFITTLKAYNRIKDLINEPLIITSYFDNDECVKYIKNQHLESYIKLTGYLDESELRETIRSSRLYVSSSLYEGFGMTPVEAIIQGVPCVIYKGTAAYESTQGLASYYDNGTDENELADKILEELQKPLEFAELEAKSDFLCSKYDYRNIAREYWNLFTEMANRKN